MRICDPYYYEYKIEKLHRKREVIVMYCLIPPGVNKFSYYQYYTIFTPLNMVVLIQVIVYNLTKLGIIKILGKIEENLGKPLPF